ncbi:hypothetical protein DACRYDRAFT_106728 [Dacryopinax primogenitus]|uniref:Phytanoyl-CoA dioxygenase n=1 Tax=Dacryopinax primogenitus (strain DJM 731) TaxID=1858805 RepID=M5G370_DACPD|nr:uncharacterized protein DACRYDRAFT_106728 [Dacryopinax primogenitus]EJU02665.1 hypothetical protein DACRYDRAFT_106728 [Dacryopinax primogenitus]
MVKYEFLIQEQREHFLEHGWLLVPNSIPKENIDWWMKDVWTRLGYDPQDPSTWEEETIWMPRHRDMLTKDFSPNAWKAMCELVGGEERIDTVRNAYSGDQFIVNLGTEYWRDHDADPRVQPNWHIDGDWYRHFLDSGEGALVVIQVYTDILPRGGGTYICEDGLPGICKFLYERPEGSGNKPDTGMYAHVKDCEKFLQVTAKAGDTLLMHAHLPHCTGKNHLRTLRVIANPHVTLKEPFNLARPNPEDNSLCEQVILRALQRNSIPEYKPTTERLHTYPRNYVAKFSRVQGELERMVRAAESAGGKREDVDSIYLKGEEEIKLHNLRNGLGAEVVDSQRVVVV